MVKIFEQGKIRLHVGANAAVIVDEDLLDEDAEASWNKIIAEAYRLGFKLPEPEAQFSVGAADIYILEPLDA